MVLDTPALSIPAEAVFEKARHVKYWTRCVKTLLPQQYIGLDSNRMYLGYFILAALDLLDALTTACTEDERKGYADWIYDCQHRDGGFRMWLGTDFGEHTNGSNAKWDPANIPATYFALAALLILGDDFKRVKRKQTLQWLQKMQRPDGSFGETLVEGQIEGGRDPRFGYCATGIRYILRGTGAGLLRLDDEDLPDIDVDLLVECIIRAESFDGGIADQPFHEPHSGYTFCSLGALSFLDRLKAPTLQTPPSPIKQGPTNPQEVIRWLVHRQTDLLTPDATLDSEFLSRPPPTNTTNPPDPPAAKLTDHELFTICAEGTIPHPSASSCAGMNGRTNKVADTCYAWWSGASLSMLGHGTLYDTAGTRKYLLSKTQHPVLGGFGKFPGDLPDLYHSYLGLAALSLAGGEGVKGVDAGMCVSQEARGRLRGLWEGWGVEG